MPVEIIPLQQRPNALPLLARWHYQEWRDLYPEESEADFRNDLCLTLDDNPQTTTYVAIVDGEICGSASIIPHDMDTLPELGPWLANVYVCKERRNQQLGTQLVLAIMNHAQLHNIPRLYLFTPDQQAFYQRLGWQEVHSDYYHQSPVTIMAYVTEKLS